MQAPPDRKWLYPAALLLLAFLVYGHTLPYPFVWDDEGLVTRNPVIASFKNFFTLWTQDLYWGKGGNVYYRPVQAFSNMVDYAIYGMRSWGYHLTNTLLHVVTGILLAALFEKLTQKRAVAWLAAALWLIHPIQPEAVTYISGRADSLCAIFVLSTLLLHIRASEEANPKKKTWLHGGAYLSFALSMWSKEIGFVVGPLLIWVDWVRGRKFDWKAWLWTLIPYGVILAGYTAARGAVLPHLIFNETEVATSGHPLGLLAFPLGLIYGLWLLIFPHPLHLERIAPGIGPDGPALAFVSLVATAGLVWFFRKHGKNLGHQRLGAGFYVICLLPLFTLFARDRLFLEHWLYLPSYGLMFGGAAWVEEHVKFTRDLKMVLLTSVMILWSVLTVNQNRIWSDPIVLYRHVLQYSPWSRRTHYNLGLAYFDRGMLDEADVEYATTTRIFPSPEVTGSIALLRLAQKKTDTALEEYNQLIEEHPDQPFYRNNRASVFYSMGRKEEAMVDLKKAIELDPKYRDALYNLGLILKEQNKMKEAQVWFEKAASFSMDGDLAFQLAQIYVAEKNADKAFEILQLAVSGDHNTPDAMNFLGVLYAQSQNPGKAIEVWREGMRKFPQDPKFRLNLEKLEELRK